MVLNNYFFIHAQGINIFLNLYHQVTIIYYICSYKYMYEHKYAVIQKINLLGKKDNFGNI